MRTRPLALAVALLLAGAACAFAAPPAGAAGGGGFVNIADAFAVEGDTGLTPMFFLLQRVESYDAACTVSVVPLNGTATWPSDWYPQGANITFAPGQQYAIFTLWVLPDDAPEPVLEHLYAVVAGADGCGIADGAAVGWIVDDDAPTGP